MKKQKIIIDHRGRLDVVLVSESGAFSLAGVVSQFIEDHLLVRQALNSAEAAGPLNIKLTRALYKHLKAQDFDPDLIVGYGFTKPLTNPCKALKDELVHTPMASVCRDLSHGIVKVSGMAIDLTHRRLGSAYQQVYNYPFREFSDYWKHVQSMSQFVDMGMEEAVSRLKNAANVSKLAPADRRRPQYYI